MAGIDKSKFVDEKPIVKAFEDINEAIKETSKYFDKLVTDAGELQKSLKDIKGFEALIKAQKEYSKLQDDAVKSQKLAIDLQQKEANLRAATAKAINAEQKNKDALTKENERLAKQAEKAARDLAKETSLYAQKSKALNEARAKAKELAIQFGLTSKEFEKAANSANKLDKELKDIDASLGQNQRNVGNYTKGVQAIQVAWAFAGAAILAAGKYILDLNVKFSKASASLRAITGASKEDMKFFETQAKSMGKTWGIAADEMLKSFERVGSIRPELLKTKEALVEVTQSAIVLSQASGGVLDLAGATEALGAGMNQFNLGAKDSERIINALAAGSQIGSAEVASLAESFKNVGAVASNANMDLEDTVASLEVLGEKSLYGAEAGTKLRGTILKLQEAGKGFASGKFNLKDALTETKAQLDAIASPIEKATFLQKMFGIENQTAGIIMLQNIDKYTKFREGVKDTTVAFDQQKIQMDSATGAMARFGSTMDSIFTKGWVADSIKWVANMGTELLLLTSIDEKAADSMRKLFSDMPSNSTTEDKIKKLQQETDVLNDKTQGLLSTIMSSLPGIGLLWEALRGAKEGYDSAKISAYQKEVAILKNEQAKAANLALIETEQNKLKNKSILELTASLLALGAVSNLNSKDKNIQIRALERELALREKLGSEEASSVKVGLSEEQIKKNLEAAKKYKAESDKIADSFFDEWERVELINIKKSEDAKEQKLKDEKAYQEASLKQSEDYLDEAMRVEQIRIDKEAEQAQKVADFKKQLKEDAISTGKDLIATMFAIEQNNYDKEAKRIEDKYSLQENLLKQQLDNDKLTVESRAQIEGQIKSLEAQREQELARIENKKRESQRKQFLVNKAIAIAEIAMSTAQSVIAMLKIGPLGIPLSIAAAALGLVQAGIVAAQPMPAFDKGTDNAPSTPFLVGEVGPEFVTHKGETQLIDKPTVMNNMGGAVVTSRIETAKILQKNARETMWSANNKGKQLDNTAAILAAQNETNRLLKKRESIKIYNDSNVNSRAQIGHNTMINKFAR